VKRREEAGTLVVVARVSKSSFSIYSTFFFNRFSLG